MSNTNLLTKEGKEKLEKELFHLVNETRAKVIADLQSARLQGDLSENADYSAAKDWQGKIESRISEINSILADCEIIDDNAKPTHGPVVKIGSKVKLSSSQSRIDGKVFSIVGTLESDTKENKISNVSPVGKAILGKAAGETVEIHGIERPYKIKIVSIQ
ncbi:MAG: transcription elongation factor GreA [Mycoplasmataceae bacterium]|nr:transcription elongation factor GreA [Mycoplasmataceae bacterium]